MTTQQSTPDPQAHATDLEMAIAHLYAAAQHIQSEAFKTAAATELAAMYQREDALMDALVNITATTQTNMSAILRAARSLR